MDWKTAEIHGYKFYSERGFDVLIRLVENSVYDFVICKNGQYKTVNVKVARFVESRKGYTFSFTHAARKKKQPPRADIYLAWLPGEEMFVPVPKKTIGNAKGTYRISFQQIRSEKNRQRAFRLRTQQEREERRALSRVRK